MGTENPSVTVQYFGNWKCPSCAEFSQGFLEDIVTDYVQSEDVNIVNRSLAYVDNKEFLGPDSPRASRAGIAMWNVSPGNYWTYHEYVMNNQPSESERWATEDNIRNALETIGVSESDVTTIIERTGSDEVQSLVRDTADLASELDITGTPYLEIDGEVYSGIGSEDEVRSAIEEHI